jgi:hypothetical protein
MGAIYLFFKGHVIAKATTRQAGRTGSPVIVGGGCADVVKKVFDARCLMLVTRNEIRSKNFFGKSVGGMEVHADLIENGRFWGAFGKFGGK